MCDTKCIIKWNIFKHCIFLPPNILNNEFGFVGSGNPLVLLNYLWVRSKFQSWLDLLEGFSSVYPKCNRIATGLGYFWPIWNFRLLGMRVEACRWILFDQPERRESGSVMLAVVRKGVNLAVLLDWLECHRSDNDAVFINDIRGSCTLVNVVRLTYVQVSVFNVHYSFYRFIYIVLCIVLYTFCFRWFVMRCFLL